MIDGVQQQLTSFSPGFWFFDGKMFKLDNQMQKFFQLGTPEISLEDFLGLVDEKASDFLWRFFSSFYEDVLTLKFTTAAATAEKYMLIQGSVLNRDARGRASCCSGYCIELKTPFSVPRIFHSSELGIWEWNGISGECQFCDNYRAMLGYAPGEAFPRTFEEWVSIVHPEDLEAVDFQRHLAIYPEFGDSFECSIRLRHKSGHYIWSIGKGFVSQRNHLGHAISIRGTNQSVEIIRRKYENSLQKVMLDPLTNTYSRDFFTKKWYEVLSSDVYPISFLYIDVCGLKMVNDTLGHEQGDKMLLTTVEIIDKVIQMPKFTIRMGGDEFLVVLPNCTSALAAECIKNLKKAQAQRGDQGLPVLFSIGKTSMIIKMDLQEIVSSAEREMQRNKEHSRREDRAVLLDYIERIRGKKVAYIDDRIDAGEAD